ncbi:MAG: primosomal protein N' [Planctomycetota bacterium]
MDDPALFPAAPQPVRPPFEGVALIVPERGLDAPNGLSYGIPLPMKDLRVGERVAVPLGRGNTTAPGLVIEVKPGEPTRETLGFDVARLKPIGERTGTALPARLVELARWVARYYCCPIGMVVASMIPAAVKASVGKRTETLIEPVPDAEPAEKLAPSAARAIEQITELPGDTFPIDARTLADRLELTNRGPINRLVRAGMLREVTRERVRTKWEASLSHAEDVRHDLTRAQQGVIDAIARDAAAFAPHLIRGVTGSGKTEVYLGAIERVIAEQPGGVIVLVPEISLTPQTAGRFSARFAHVGVAVLHSGLTASQRHAEWARVRDDEVRIVVGARSAVFAPFDEPLAMIVVDEEHDASYKQDQAPRYHARDVAIRRAHADACPIVLGSATPSLESWHNAKIGRFTLHELTERVGGGAMPRVRIVDLNDKEQHTYVRGERSPISPALKHALTATLDDGGQAILLLNRRGFASYIACASQCGWQHACEHCSVSLVMHKRRLDDAKGHARCHHCLAQTLVPKQCPVCGSRAVLVGVGTQRLEEHLREQIPSVLSDASEPLYRRVDADTMRHAGDYFEVLDAFRRGAVRLLLGTQMIAKGLDFPNVRLVGIVNADTGASLPDFRAPERTFQLVSQVAGRAGRSKQSEGARVIAQTMNAQDPTLALAANHDYVAFAERELQFRRDAGLPPSTRMARIVCRHTDADRARASAADVADAARGLDGVRVDGPMPCFFERISDHFRFAVELTGESAEAVQRAIATLRSMGLARSDATTTVDVDPVHLL